MEGAVWQGRGPGLPALRLGSWVVPDLPWAWTVFLLRAPGSPIQEALFALEGKVPEVPGLDMPLWRQATPNGGAGGTGAPRGCRPWGSGGEGKQTALLRFGGCRVALPPEDMDTSP